MQNAAYTVHTFKEGDAFVAYVPELDVSSCGSTSEEARRNIRDAVQGFLETSAEMGTLNQILRTASAMTRQGGNRICFAWSSSRTSRLGALSFQILKQKAAPLGERQKKRR